MVLAVTFFSFLGASEIQKGVIHIKYLFLNFELCLEVSFSTIPNAFDIRCSPFPPSVHFTRLRLGADLLGMQTQEKKKKFNLYKNANSNLLKSMYIIEITFFFVKKTNLYVVFLYNVLITPPISRSPCTQHYICRIDSISRSGEGGGGTIK